MNKKIYLIFSAFFFSQSENKIKKNQNNKTTISKKSDEETVFNLFMKISEQKKNTDLLIMKFISDQKYGIEKIIKANIAALLSIAQIKLEEVPDKIILKPISLSAFLIISSVQDALTEILNYSASDIKEILRKSEELAKNPKKYKEILSKLYQGDFSQLKHTMPEKHAKRLSNSKNYKKTTSDLILYSDILIDLLVFLSQNSNYNVTDEEINAINRLLNKRFEGKFYEKLSKVNQSLEILKKEVQKDNFQESYDFFNIMFSQIKINMEQKLKNKNTQIINTQNLSTSDKKEIIQITVEYIYVILEELQPNKIEKLIKSTKKMV